VIKALTKINFTSSKTEPESQIQETQLVDNYSRAVYKFCRSLTYTIEDADDLFQDTFLKVFTQMDKIKKKENKLGFLFSTAAFLWKSRRRKYARRKVIAPEVEINETQSIDTLANSLEDNYIAQDELRFVRGLVETLPVKYKIPIILYYTNELSIKEISAILNLAEGTVKSRLHKARKIIEKGLKCAK